MPFNFDGFVLDERLVELRRNGETVAVEPQVFDVLSYLITNRDRVVPKAELLDVVWGDQFVSESALTTCIKLVRQAVGDNGRDQRVIKTSHGRGYRFVSAVDVVVDPDAGPEVQANDTTAVPPPPPTERAVDRSVRTRPAPRGREADVDSIRRRLEIRRLVTLVGMGGIGKTYLLHHLNRELATGYADGPVEIELAPVRSGDAVGPALLEAARDADKAIADPTDAFLDWLEGREVLLLIDNAEHVAAEVAALCRRVLDRCPAVDVLVTSRTRLEIPGESVHLVGPLDLEPAVALFVERAFDGGVDLDSDNPDLQRLCEKLDGVPLALEIMAARAPLLSLADLLADLERHLAATNPGGDERHRTLEATLRWSLDGLADRERQLLEDLTVFAGSFDLDAAEAVAKVDDVTEPLLDLCRRSLVLPGPSDETSRFRLLEPVRLFAASTGESLGRARARHADYYRHLATRADELIASHDIDRGMELMSLEWPNIRAAFNTYSSDRDVDAMTSLVCASANYAEARLLAEVYEWADRVHEMALAESVEPDVVLVGNVARFSSHTGRLDRINELLDEVDPDHSSNHVRMGFIVRDWYQGRSDAVSQMLDRAIAELDGQGGFWEATFIVLRLLSSAMVDHRPVHLVDRLEALAETDGLNGALFAQVGKGVRLIWEGKSELAAIELDNALAKTEAMGTAGFTQLVHGLLYRTQHAMGESGKSAAVLAELIERAVESGGLSLAADSLGPAAAVLADGGRPDVGARLLAALRSAGYRFSNRYESMLKDRVHGALDAAELAENDERGGRLSLTAAVDLALEELKNLAESG